MTEKETPLERLNKDIRDGKVAMRNNWLPEMGDRISILEFDQLWQDGEIENAQIIGAPETSGGVYWQPHQFVWGIKESKIVYSQFGNNDGGEKNRER